MRKIFLALVGVVISAMLLAACGDGGESGDGGSINEDMISVGTSPMGSGWYTLSITLADIWMDEVDGMNVNVLEGGSVANLRGVNEGKDLQVGWTYTADLNDALTKSGAFAEEEKALDNVKVIGLNYPAFLQIFTTEDSDIHSVKDFLGKKVHAGAQGAGQELAFQRILEAYGLSYDEITNSGGSVSFGNYNDSATQLQDGIVDVAVASGAPEVAAYKEIENLNDIRVVPIDQEILDELAEFGYLNDHPLPANTYLNQDSDVPTVAYQSAIIVNANISEDRVYEMTKAMWENVETIVDQHPARGEYFSPEIAVEGLDVENLHPGAAKYYKEIGVIE